MCVEIHTYGQMTLFFLNKGAKVIQRKEQLVLLTNDAEWTSEYMWVEEIILNPAYNHTKKINLKLIIHLNVKS